MLPRIRPPLLNWTEVLPSHGRPIADADILAWVLTEGHRTDGIAELLDKLSWRLVGEGVPLWRSTLSISTLHPQLIGFGLRWWRDRGQIEEVEVTPGVTGTADYLESPMRPTIERGEVVRHRLDRDDIARFPLLVALKAAGATDYLSLPLTFDGNRHQVATFATDRAQGFADADLATFARILAALAVVVEGKSKQRLMANVLATYLGPTIGRHILNGEIHRRQGEAIRAALIATDLRGFTALSDRLPPDELIALLDDYFEAVTSPIQDQGGEVLKFVGDGVLAIFGVNDGGEGEAARAALAAGQGALARLALLNERRAADGLTPIRIGVGLHLGSVFYGNVGAPDRLDFTAIGPAVNLVCRLESLTKRLDRPLLLSRDFAQSCGMPLVSLGFHPVRGLSEPEEVFGLPDGEAIYGSATA